MGATKYIIEVNNAVPTAPPMIARLILATVCSSSVRRLVSPAPFRTIEV